MGYNCNLRFGYSLKDWFCKRWKRLTGRPLGNDEFITRIEQIFNMRLRPLARGRPRKEE
jgi:hypothetical protein